MKREKTDNLICYVDEFSAKSLVRLSLFCCFAETNKIEFFISNLR